MGGDGHTPCKGDTMPRIITQSPMPKPLTQPATLPSLGAFLKSARDVRRKGSGKG